MRAVLVVLLAAGCLGKPPRPDGEPVDGPNGTERPRLVAHQPADRTQGSSLAYAISVPEVAHPYLLVTIQVGTNCDDTAPPINLADLQDANGGSQQLTSIAMLDTTPCLGNTHSELFELRQPAAGTYTVVVSVAGIAPSLHSAALVFAGVDRENPTRVHTTASGESAMTRVLVPSTETDLIVNTVGHGALIEGPGSGEMEIFRRNVDTTTTLNNSGASFAPGTGSMVEMTWEAAGVDQWQTISTALRAAP